jgi:hypothetical protein
MFDGWNVKFGVTGTGLLQVVDTAWQVPVSAPAALPLQTVFGSQTASPSNEQEAADANRALQVLVAPDTQVPPLQSV